MFNVCLNMEPRKRPAGQVRLLLCRKLALCSRVAHTLADLSLAATPGVWGRDADGGIGFVAAETEDKLGNLGNFD